MRNDSSQRAKAIIPQPERHIANIPKVDWDACDL